MSFVQYALIDIIKIFIVYIATKFSLMKLMMERTGYNVMNAEDGFINSAQMCQLLKMGKAQF